MVLPINIQNIFSKSTHGTTPRYNKDRFSDWKNVMDFGAKGDGTTNDHDAIQRAIDWNSITATVQSTTAAGSGAIVFGSNLTPAQLNAIDDPIAVRIKNLTAPTSLIFEATVESVNHPAGIINLNGGGAAQPGAINAGHQIQFSFAERGTIYLPPAPNFYNIGNQSLDLNYIGALSIIFQGSGEASSVRGSINGGALFDRSYGNPNEGSRIFRDLHMINGGAGGVGVYLAGGVGQQEVNNCNIRAHRGIMCLSGNSWLITNTKLIWDRSVGSVGIMASNGVSIINCDISGYDHAVRHHNAGLQVIGGRYEVNNTAFMLGMDQNDVKFSSTAFFLTGMSMESNRCAIDIYAGVQGMITGTGQGSGHTQRTTNAATPAGNNVLHFDPPDATHPGVENFHNLFLVRTWNVGATSTIPKTAQIIASTPSTITLSENVTGAGVASGANIHFLYTNYGIRLRGCFNTLIACIGFGGEINEAAFDTVGGEGNVFINNNPNNSGPEGVQYAEVPGEYWKQSGLTNYSNWAGRTPYVGPNARWFVTDGNVAAASPVGTVITGGGGSYKGPMYHDGTAWKVG